MKISRAFKLTTYEIYLPEVKNGKIINNKVDTVTSTDDSSTALKQWRKSKGIKRGSNHIIIAVSQKEIKASMDIQKFLDAAVIEEVKFSDNTQDKPTTDKK